MDACLACSVLHFFHDIESACISSQFETLIGHIFGIGQDHRAGGLVNGKVIRAKMRLGQSKTLFAYWDGIRAGRVAPTRFEIEPSGLSEILPDTFILESDQSRLFRYRLAGTRVCDRLGTEFRGTDFMTSWGRYDRVCLARAFDSVVKDGAVLCAQLDATFENGSREAFEMVILPLVHTNNRIDRFLGALSSDVPFDPFRAKGRPSLQLSHTDLHVPERAELVQTMQAPPEAGVFDPLVRTARIVRHERRAFRVYDGGLADRPKDPR